ncbi:hypothetical protein GOBAR_AA23568 [Gossypium barbadense]|uniref:Uncharacterized protein n=1 Tax=Gossypium barbadense TaxID=3634 RepID=A0A2P5X191_GOSBA|nr:hypothetical protein GOBAR_AA23568 [Gossypium barbadense]
MGGIRPWDTGRGSNLSSSHSLCQDNLYRSIRAKRLTIHWEMLEQPVDATIEVPTFIGALEKDVSKKKGVAEIDTFWTIHMCKSTSDAARQDHQL